MLNGSLAKGSLGEYYLTAQALSAFPSQDIIVARRPVPKLINWPRVGVITAIVGGFFGFVTWYDRSRLPDMIASQDVGLNQKVSNVEGKIDVILSALLKKVASQTSSEELKGDLEMTALMLTTAQERGVVLNPQVISEVGRDLIYRPTDNTWDVATQFVNYQTFINSKIAKPPRLPSATEQVRLQIGGSGTPATIRDYELKDMNVILDNANWENIVFSNCTITYHGGHSSLKNVYFINCRFDLARANQSQSLAQAILSSVPVAVDL